MKDILEKLNEIFSLIEKSNLKLLDKLLFTKNLLELRLEILKIFKEFKPKGNNSRVYKNYYSREIDEKQELLLSFIKTKGGRVGVSDLSSLGIPGRTLRRYLKKLRDENKIKVEKFGRNYFYKLV